MTKLTLEIVHQRTLAVLLSIAEGTVEGVAVPDRVVAASYLLDHVAAGLDFTDMDEQAEADTLDRSDDKVSPPADKPKRTRKPKESAPPPTETPAEAPPADDDLGETEAEGDYSQTWDDEPPAEEEKAPVESPATKDEVIALLNRYAAKHPKKGQGAKDAISKYGSPSLKDISPGDYSALASDLRAYLAS